MLVGRANDEPASDRIVDFGDEGIVILVERHEHHAVRVAGKRGAIVEGEVGFGIESNGWQARGMKRLRLLERSQPVLGMGDVEGRRLVT